MVSVTEVAISCMASRLDAHTSPMLGHSAGINSMGLCARAGDPDVQLVLPSWGCTCPKPMSLRPAARLPLPYVPHASVYVRGVRATSITPCITCCPGAYASTEGSLRLRLG